MTALPRYRLRAAAPASIKRLASELRHWLIRRLAGKAAVLLNVEVRGMVLTEAPTLIAHDLLLDPTPNLHDGDPYAWFTPVRPQPCGIGINLPRNADGGVFRPVDGYQTSIRVARS